MDPETLRWLLTAVAIPAGLGLWALITRVIIPYYQKEATVSSASARERDRSLQVFGETQAGRAQDRSNDIQDKLVAFLLASNDGKISEILDTSKGGTAQVVSLILRVSAEQAERDRLIIASYNQLITLFSQFLASQPERTLVSDFGLALKIKEASIDSEAVQQVKGISMAAVASELTDAARTMQPGRVIEVMQALQDGLRGK